MIDPKSAEAFYWVVKLGRFAKAAEKLHTTQPAISNRVAQLERQLGVRLLERDRRRRVSLTPKGVEFYDYAERILALHGEAAAAMTEEDRLVGTVRLGVSETIVHTWLPLLLKLVHDRHPRLTLDISVDITPSLRDGVLHGDIDVALLLGPVSAPRLVNLPLCQYEIGWIGRPDLDAGAEPLSAAALRRWPLITYSRSTRPYIDLASALARHSPERPPRIFCNSSLSSIVRMVQDGIGIGVIASAAIRRELERGELRLLQVDVPLPPLTFTAAYLETPGSSMTATVAHLASTAAASEHH